MGRKQGYPHLTSPEKGEGCHWGLLRLCNELDMSLPLFRGSDCLELQDGKRLWNEEFVESFVDPSLRMAGLVSGRSLAQATVRAWEILASVPFSPTSSRLRLGAGLVANLPNLASSGSKFQVTRLGGGTLPGHSPHKQKGRALRPAFDSYSAALLPAVRNAGNSPTSG